MSVLTLIPADLPSDLDPDPPAVHLVCHGDDVVAGRLGGTRDVARALGVVEQQVELGATR